MASTYIVKGDSIQFNTNKSLLALFNTAASGKILRVYRVWLANNQVSTVASGGMAVIQLLRITAASAGTPIVPKAFDTTATALGTVVAGTNMTVTDSSIFRRISWSYDEPTVQTGTNDEFETFQFWSILWDTGYNDSNVEPLVLREGEGVSIKNTTTLTANFIDCFIEFTVT